MAGEGERASHHCVIDPCGHADDCLVVTLTVVVAAVVVVGECVVAVRVVVAQGVDIFHLIVVFFF